MSYSQIPADTKDWTVVLRDGCAECGFRPGYAYEENISRLKALEAPILTAFNSSEMQLYVRPSAQTWAPIEYLAHIAEVCEVMMDRLQLMLVQDNPEFANWNQDAAAAEGDYINRPVGHVKRDLLTNLQHAVAEFNRVPGDLLARRGRRGDGEEFTIQTLAEYFVHDLEHHIHHDI
ncbi:MAG: DinB family protein [Rothia sp. (in: high G+C Gram-positive bacteria)]|nr:DinB family protein [Rothia sp. (in: high G+C Gram-positive bacteria)]